MPHRISIVDRRQLRLIVRSLSPASVAFGCVAVFAVFSILGFVRDIIDLGRQPGWRVALDAALQPSNGTIDVVLVTGVGPRLIRYGFAGGDNALALTATAFSDLREIETGKEGWWT